MGRRLLLCLATALFICGASVSAAFGPRAWTYTCEEDNSRCVRAALEGDGGATNTSEARCKLQCNHETDVLWPLPREIHREAGSGPVAFDSGQIRLGNIGYYEDTVTKEWLEENIQNQTEWLLKKQQGFPKTPSATTKVAIYFVLGASSTTPQLSKSTNESYSLEIAFLDDNDDQVNVTITSDDYFGARHALETLFQLMDFDDLTGEFVVLAGIEIRDWPEFGHRGVSVDTSRNFQSKEVLMRIVDGMAHSKLNVFHWHMTDTNSFPFELKDPEIAVINQYGAYNALSIYDQEWVATFIEYATKRGVRIVPELDQPAHVGNGWNVPGWENLTSCVNQEQWYDLCVQPPCGQLNPNVDKVYDILEKIYQELYNTFPFKEFHMGADEVQLNCWNQSAVILEYLEEQGMGRTEEDFHVLIKMFMEKSLERLRGVAGENPVDVTIWSSSLTTEKYIDDISKDDYTIQFWTNLEVDQDTEIGWEQIRALVQREFKIIFSNTDATYLDCGYGGWVGEGNNYCSPYKGWQKQYENDLYKLLADSGLTVTPAMKELVLGGEVAMWAEQTDSFSIESKIFPRASAFGERLWSNPSTGFYEAETRILEHRRRLVDRGVRADALQPEWCRQNTGQCYIVWPYDDDATTTTTSTVGDGASSLSAAGVLWALVLVHGLVVAILG